MFLCGSFRGYFLFLILGINIKNIFILVIRRKMGMFKIDRIFEIFGKICWYSYLGKYKIGKGKKNFFNLKLYGFMESLVL